MRASRLVPFAFAAVAASALAGCVIDRRQQPIVEPRPVASADGRNPFSKVRFPIEVRPPSRPAHADTTPR